MEIEVNLDAMTLEDLVTLQKAAAGSLDWEALLTVLDRVVVGGARRLPVARLREITTALNDAITRELGN